VTGQGLRATALHSAAWPALSRLAPRLGRSRSDLTHCDGDKFAVRERSDSPSRDFSSIFLAARVDRKAPNRLFPAVSDAEAESLE
jgi:hypothetical protein